MKKSIIIAICASLLCACSLEEYPYGFYSEDNFYKTEADAVSATNYIYDAINYIEYSRAIVFLGDMNTDSMDPKASGTAANLELDGWKMATFRTNATLYNLYHYSYITINRANSVIENVGSMNIDESIKNPLVGEGYFMRAYSYYNLTRNFGCVPMHLKTVRKLDDTIEPAAESLDVVWKQIFDDLDEAIKLMPVYAAPVTGRTDRIAACALAAKACLYLASAKEHGVPRYADMSIDVEQYYAKAVEYASKVVDDPAQKTYGFEPNLLDIYDVEKPTGPEHIFIMSMDRTGKSEGQYSKISKMYIPYVSGGTIYLKQGDCDVLIASHDGWSEYCTNKDFYAAFEAGDLRHDWLFCNEVYNAAGEVTASVANGKLTYPFCRKFIDPQFVGDKTSTKPFLIRYSDIALVYAEAAGPTAKAYSLVNYIRHRAGLGDATPGLAKDAFRDMVRTERKWEMAFEGDYAYDLRRTNRIHLDVVAAREQGLTAEDVVFYPIPSLESDLNPYM